MQSIRDINLRIITPCSRLKEHIHSIWVAKNSHNKGELFFKILNDGSVGVTFNFGGELRIQQNESVVSINEGCIVSGASTSLQKMTFSGCVSTIGIRFNPAFSHYFFKCSITELANRVAVPSQDHLIDIDVLYAKLKVLVATNNREDQTIKAIEAHLITLLCASPSQPQNTLVKIINAMANNHNITLGEISERYSISSRETQRLFRRYVGVSPKSFARLIRVRTVKTKIAENSFESLTQLSVDCGYFDQAHCSHDFKMLMEQTPRDYHKLKILGHS